MSDNTSANKTPDQSSSAEKEPLQSQTDQAHTTTPTTPGDQMKSATPGKDQVSPAVVQSGNALGDPITEKTAVHIVLTNAEEKVVAPTNGATPTPAGKDGASPTDDTLPRKPAAETGEQKVAATASALIPPVAESLPDIENPYILSGEVDRARLVAQTRLFRNYIEANAKQFVGHNIKSILDMGCGEGQLTLVFAKLYPEAKVVGIDRDEKAIEVARRAAKGSPNVSFEVGDIQERLPAGPFDLIYESLVLMHVPNTRKVISLVFDALTPGGYFWSKDLLPSIATAIDHPAYARLSEWMGTAMDRIGSPWRIGGQLSELLTAANFKSVKLEKEVYALGNANTEERITMSVNLGAIYNARKLMSKVLQIPETEMEKAYKEVATAMLTPGGPRGEYVYMNGISQRPA